MNCVQLNNLSLKSQMSTPSGYTDIEILKKDLVARTQFLYIFFQMVKKYVNGWLNQVHLNKLDLK